MPQLMQDIQVLQSSPFHSIASVTVHLDPDPKQGGDVYPESGKLAIAKAGFMKLLSAAGMEEIPEQCVSEIRGDGVYYAKEVLKWTQPDGKEIILSGDKLMDLRIGGARWQKAHEKAMDFEVTSWAKTNGHPKKTKPNGYDENSGEWSSRVQIELEIEGGHEELLRIFDITAKHKANRIIHQAAQFGIELAQSGATNRAVKAQLGLKSTYTVNEIKEGFIILRSEFRWDMIQEAIGDKSAKALTMGFLAKQMGVGVDDLMQLEAGVPAIQHPTEPEDVDEPVNPFGSEEKDVVIEAESDEAVLFKTPVVDTTGVRIRNKLIAYHGWRNFNRSKANDIAMWIFNGRFYSDLSEGEMRLLIALIDKLALAKKSGDSDAKRKQQAGHLKEQIDQCVIEQRMWREPATQADQIELPGIMLREELTEVTDENEPASSTTE